MNEAGNDKTASIVKLGLWLIFIIVLVIISRFGGTQENNVEEENTATEEVEVIAYEEKLEKLTDNYKYSYEIKLGENIYKFEGSKMGTKESGYRLLGEKYLYYFLENGYVYQVSNGGLDKIESIYDNIDSSYLDVSKIKEIILNKEFVETDKTYSYSLEDKNIIIYTDEENITKIEIKIAEDYYILEYSDIGLITEINY